VDAARLPARDGTREAGRAVRWLALALGAVTVALVFVTLPLANAAGMHSTVGSSFVLTLIAFVIVGVVLTRSRPRNPIGWVMLAGALFGGLTTLAGPYVVYSYRLHHHLPLAPVAVMFQPSWAPTILLCALGIMLFPDGALPPGIWRWAVGWVGLVGGLWMIGAFAIAGQAIYEHRVVIEATGDLSQIDHPTSGWAWWSDVQGVFFLSFLVVLLLWLLSRVPAYRAASGERREQLKWLICGGSLACIGIVVSVVLSDNTGVLGAVGHVAILGLLGIPISLGVGVTKYRLYDIDRLISRTLSYTLLTGALLAVFAGVVLLTTRVLPFSSPVGVAASTLAVAALFGRLRVRLQRLVDSRFNRARYDAEALVGAFGASLRNAVDLDTVRGGLIDTVTQAVEPAYVSVWLREDRAVSESH
jgi:hypothetical protein